MKNVNQTAIDSASTVFEKVGDNYIGSKSRFGDILIGAPYSEAFVKAYASERKDVLVIPKTIEYTAFLRSDEMKEVAKKSESPNSESDDYLYGITDEDIQEAIKEARRDRAQDRRDEIVEQAKADVEKLIEDTTQDYCYVDFIVNRSKRTVVALIKGVYNGRDVFARGIAKAAPSDCFNVHIGKAIALRRALGLAVPDEYLNAPQPTEVRVGDVVEGWAVKDTALVISDDAWPPISGAWIPLKYARQYELRIIDDSREEVGE